MLHVPNDAERPCDVWLACWLNLRDFSLELDRCPSEVPALFSRLAVVEGGDEGEAIVADVTSMSDRGLCWTVGGLTRLGVALADAEGKPVEAVAEFTDALLRRCLDELRGRARIA